MSCSQISYIHGNLNKLGLSNVWLAQKTFTLSLFKVIVNTRRNDQFIQKWFTTVSNAINALITERINKNLFVRNISNSYPLILLFRYLNLGV